MAKKTQEQKYVLTASQKGRLLSPKKGQWHEAESEHPIGCSVRAFLVGGHYC